MGTSEGIPAEVLQLLFTVRLKWGERTCYIHNIYAPNDAAARMSLFQRLPVDFENDAIHIVCGDFNLALDPVVDSITGERRPDSSVEPLRSWLSELNVVDVWRLHNPQERVYSGPIPRRNRLDYIFVCDSLVASSYENSQYHSWDESDHLAYHVELASWHHNRAWILETPKLAGANTRTKV
ncbi:unnamed protein product [Phytophthora lilii]|uniref:Unnamed protein product n=1 Tax=Phytophthora lilii TaxID=2077276 RepID=A0A9W7CK60_9STRA|nr:unnamed protein product [Phytophthora lilii]